MVTKLYACLAVLFLILGIIGIFLPVLPTTPFILVAAWAASKGSPRLHAWLHAHPHMGPLLTAWNERGAVPLRAKWLACSMMALSWTTLLIAGLPWLWLGILGAVFLAVAAYVTSRPNA